MKRLLTFLIAACLFTFCFFSRPGYTPSAQDSPADYSSKPEPAVSGQSDTPGLEGSISPASLAGTAVTDSPSAVSQAPVSYLPPGPVPPPDPIQSPRHQVVLYHGNQDARKLFSQKVFSIRSTVQLQKISQVYQQAFESDACAPALKQALQQYDDRYFFTGQLLLFSYYSMDATTVNYEVDAVIPSEKYTEIKLKKTYRPVCTYTDFNHIFIVECPKDYSVDDTVITIDSLCIGNYPSSR